MEWYYITYGITWYVGLSFLGCYYFVKDGQGEPYEWSDDLWGSVIFCTFFVVGLLLFLLYMPANYLYKKAQT